MPGRVGVPRRGLGRVGSSVVALVSVGALLAGCSSDDKHSSAGVSGSPSASASPKPAKSTKATASPTEAATPSLPVPAGVELTPEGSQLQLGDSATVAWKVRQGVVGVLDIKVTRLERTSFKKSFVGWDLDEQQKQSNPYFVRVRVKNRGDTNLGGQRIPLYIVDGDNTLVEATTFASSFKPCEPGGFPAKFKTGSKLQACLVFLSPKHGDLTAVSFRPTQASDPITWSGKLKSPRPDKAGHGGRGG